MDTNATAALRPVFGGDSSAALPDIPLGIRDFVAIDVGEGVLYAEQRRSGDPHVLTYLARCNEAGIALALVAAGADVIARERAREGRIARPDDEALYNRQAALALLRNAAELRVSDIHILRREEYVEIQVRIKGELRVMDRLLTADGDALMRAFYQSIATSRDASYNIRDVQNAQISGADLAESGLSSVRIVRGPAFPAEAGGNFMVLRLQYGSANLARSGPGPGSGSGAVRPRALRGGGLVEPQRPPGEFRLAGMGFTAKQVEDLRFLADAPNGVVILTGPTGSGKTSTIFECIAHLGREYPGKRTITIEDPVEYPMPWAVQLEVQNAVSEADTGRAFGHYLRAALRMDPDNLLCGEIRGAEVALATIAAAITGHLVYTTLHVTDPYLAIDRIEQMDPRRLDRKTFCNHKIIRGIVAQRLVPRLCDGCAVPLRHDPDRLPPAMLSALRTYGDIDHVRLRGKGCPDCGGDGWGGRLAVAEVVVANSAMMVDFVTGGSELARRNHRARDGADRSLLENALARSLAGDFDPRDVARHVDIIVPRGSE